jgi:hypothetical protein
MSAEMWGGFRHEAAVEAKLARTFRRSTGWLFSSRSRHYRLISISNTQAMKPAEAKVKIIATTSQ